MPTPAELLAQSLTALRNAKRFSHTSNSYRKDNPAEYAKVIAYLDGGARPDGVSSQMGQAAVLEEDVRRALAPASPDPPSTYPASFFTGPLGNNNIVPADPNGALTLMWCGKVGFSQQQTRDLVTKRITDCGRTFDGIMHQVDQLTAGGVSSEQWVHGLGSFNIIDWGGGQNGAGISAINSGSQDGVIQADADRYKNFGQRMMLRLFHEFNGNWFPWSATVASAPQWIDAYRRVVNIFKTRGASNVGFVWCPTEGQDRAARDACYPGDAYVDWVSTTTYNGCLGTSDWCTPLHGGWATFRELFDYTALGSNQVSTYTRYAQRKPFIPTETGSKYDTSNVNRKGDWFRQVDADGFQNMPHLAGVTWFDQDLRPDESHDWWVDHGQPGQFSAESYAGFKDLVKIPRWNVGVA